MAKKQKRNVLIVLLLLLVVLMAAIALTYVGGRPGTIKEEMRDAMLHEENKISLFGLIDVDPSLISGFIVTAVLLVLAACIRIFVIPKFKYIPGKFQLLIEEWVGIFDNLAKTNSPSRNGFLGAYIFTVGSYIFVGTMFELFGIQGISTKVNSISLPAPLADINGAVCMGVLSYLVIMSGGIAGNGIKGIGKTLKDFSLPISMSFRLFGALSSGMLVTELVYYYIQLSFVLPVIVGVLFTVMHALIQAYVLTMLTSFYYGEVSEKTEKVKKVKKAEVSEKLAKTNMLEA